MLSSSSALKLCGSPHSSGSVPDSWFLSKLRLTMCCSRCIPGVRRPWNGTVQSAWHGSRLQARPWGDAARKAALSGTTFAHERCSAAQQLHMRVAAKHSQRRDKVAGGGEVWVAPERHRGVARQASEGGPHPLQAFHPLWPQRSPRARSPDAGEPVAATHSTPLQLQTGRHAGSSSHDVQPCSCRAAAASSQLTMPALKVSRRSASARGAAARGGGGGAGRGRWRGAQRRPSSHPRGASPPRARQPAPARTALPRSQVCGSGGARRGARHQAQEQGQGLRRRLVVAHGCPGWQRQTRGGGGPLAGRPVPAAPSARVWVTLPQRWGALRVA